MKYPNNWKIAMYVIFIYQLDRIDHMTLRTLCANGREENILIIFLTEWFYIFYCKNCICTHSLWSKVFGQNDFNSCSIFMKFWPTEASTYVVFCDYLKYFLGAQILNVHDLNTNLNYCRSSNVLSLYCIFDWLIERERERERERVPLVHYIVYVHVWLRHKEYIYYKDNLVLIYGM
jgi:hypothetical protein